MDEIAFQGEVVMVYITSKDFVPRIKSPRWVSMDGRRFLSGIAVDARTKGNWVHGKTVHIPVEAIVTIVEVGTEADVVESEAQYAQDEKRKSFFKSRRQ